ncbi:MAG: hypothetical protein MUP98_11245 [Candidatus Aminicenantes bacterium]|nr:hypothetical protein [Candidatus Aminicenantes bacterium]
MNNKNSATRKPGEKRLGLLGLIFCTLLFLIPSIFAQTGQSNSTVFKDNAPSIFIDCEVYDIGFLQKEIKFVNHVQDLSKAQVLVLITKLEEETGGTQYTLSFKGQKEFQGDDDTMKYFAATEEETQKGLADTLRLGLMRYVGKTPISKEVSIQLMDTVKPTDVEDKWDFWVFSMSANTFLDGQSLMKSGDFYGNIAANRVTEELKIRMSINASLSKDTFTFGDEDIESSSNSQSFSGLVVKSISDHWSVGAYFGASSSTYGNTKLSISPAPAVEFNLFPYSESTKREFRFLYRLNFMVVKYREETIYEKLSENLWGQSLSAILEVKQKWGTLSASLTGSHYFHDFSKNRLRMNADLSLRIIKGLNFNIDGSYSLIHDQLSLPWGGSTLDEIFLRRTELATTYNYGFSVGLSYSFGSIYSKVVNPRFGSGGTSISISM